MLCPLAGLSPFARPHFVAGGGGVITDYANPGGTGERNSIILITSSAGLINSDNFPFLINGSQGNETWFNAGVTLSSSVFLKFDFGVNRVIDQAIFYQSAATAQGDWQWQGSTDNSAWTSIGSSFTLSSATQTLTSLNGNTTAYRYYRMLGVSGSTSAAPYLREIEFKIGPLAASSTSYANTLGTGDRTASITATTTVTWNGTFTNIINGNTTESNNWMSGGGSSGLYIRFDLGSAKFIDEAKWYQDSATVQGLWKWQGSNDASSWTDITNPFYLGASATQTIYFSPTHSTSYRYYQLICVSGSTSSAAYQREVEFKIGP